MSDPVIIVSCDGHMAAPLTTYKQYLESKYHDALMELESEVTEFKRFNERIAQYDADGAAADGQGDPFGEKRAAGGYDVKTRLAENDIQGVAAEIIFEGTQFETAAWFNVQNSKPFSAELRTVGSRAYHRWMADCIAESEGRMVAILEPGPCHDMKATIEELKWCREHGFVGTQVPGAVLDPTLPDLGDKHFEPFWAACADLGLQLIAHGGWGLAQGDMFKFLQRTEEATAAGSEGMLTEVISGMDGVPMTQSDGPGPLLWRLLQTGVFDRYPQLKYIPTEAHSGWVPGLLSYLDKQFEEGSPSLQGLKKTPSEYWESNCLIGISFMKPSEVEIRDQFGVERILFGVDYPHSEGTWPNNLDWIRAAFRGVPENEARLILGENAIRVFGLDRERLKAVANRIGPKPEEILGNHVVKPELINHFQRRSGFLNPVDTFDESSWGPMFKTDGERMLRHNHGALI